MADWEVVSSVPAKPAKPAPAVPDWTVTAHRPAPTGWQDVKGNPATPVRYDRFGHGIDAQGNILERTTPAAPAPQTPAQQGYDRAHPAQIIPGRGPVAEAINTGAAGLRTFADTISGGWANKGDALVDAVMHPEYGGTFADRFTTALNRQNDTSKTAALAHPVAAASGKTLGVVGQAALVPAKAPIVGSAILGAVNASGHARGGAGAHLKAAATGGFVGGVLGAGAKWAAGDAPTSFPDAVSEKPPAQVSSLPQPPRVTPTEAAALNKYASRVKPDPAAMAARGAQFEDAGISPTLTDVTDESGRGVIQAAASRVSGGRQVAQDFADARALDLPDRISNQARTVISADPRTPDQIASELAATRSSQADAQFGAVRGEAAPLTADGAQALRATYAQRAITEAANRERDPAVAAALADLSRWAESGASTPPPTFTVGMADRISRVLLGKAQEAARSGDGDLAATLSKLGGDIRSPVAEAVPGYGEALSNYGAHSKLIDAVEVGQNFLSRNTDEFNAALAAMSPEERAVAQAAARRAVERASGENVGSAPGVAARIATAPEQQSRNAALLGQDQADRLQSGMKLEGDAVQNARQIAPRSGSPTNIRGINQENLNTASDVVGTVAKAGRGDLLGAAFDTARLWLKSRGFSDAEAEALVKLSTDPARTKDVIDQLATRGVGRSQAGAWVSSLRKTLTAPATVPYPALVGATAVQQRGQ